MPRSQNKVASKRKRKKLLSMAKGYWGARSKVLTVAKHHVEKGLLHAYRDRKLKKRTYRQIWIARINAAVRVHGLNYSKFIHALDVKGVDINRKVLANMTVESPKAFSDLVTFIMN